MGILKTVARKVVFPIIVKSGAEKLFSAFASNNKLILCYHGIVSQPNLNISVGPLSITEFEQHLQYFKQHFDVVPMQRMFEMYRDNYTPKRKTVAITFDDGYENNYTKAFPLLKKYNFPSTMFIISQCIENDGMVTWYDHLDIIKARLNPAAVDTSVVNRDRVNTIGQLQWLIKTLTKQERDILYTEFDKQVKLEDVIGKYPKENWKLMNKQQIVELSKTGLVEIAAHSHNHPNLGEIPPADAKNEVTVCKSVLENAIQQSVNSLAFPDGSYNNTVKELCTHAGYKSLLALEYRCPDDVTDKSVLTRYCLSSTTTYESNIVSVNRAFNSLGF